MVLYDIEDILVNKGIKIVGLNTRSIKERNNKLLTSALSPINNDSTLQNSSNLASTQEDVIQTSQGSSRTVADDESERDSQ